MEVQQELELEEEADQINMFLVPPPNPPVQAIGNTPFMTGERRRVFVERTGILSAVYS